ncbi:3 terminal rna ribose 2-o-methyltransferase hen1 [Stylonychia lemnae]|uniref:Small RNA 2'-O-methyltransferase n=1 Tax=Stylonychia lemnae TaxID=5949 RepID=A0A078AYD3_STYLE|nr:3 terminal rna ribose 2-o-methyltransferase hen1 [Stylonychia lemnae]|eukprot:CDW85803.1 3 terminal rna ribose 2-o-methyltransferase hen1 [Stylonychia lemnae]
MAQKKLASDATLRLIDLGCGKGSFLRYCLNSRILNHYIGIDIKLSKVEKASNYLAIHSLDLKSSFQESLKYKSRRYNTIIQNYVARQMSSAFETYQTLRLKHLQQDKIPTLIDNVFGLIQPDIVIMTTPNKDFNHMFKNFENPEQLRCEDHVFEYKEQEFKQFCDEIIQKYGHYQYKIEGLMYENAYNIKKEYKNSFTEIPASLLVTFIKSKNTFAHYKIQNQNGVNKIFNDPIFTQNYYKDIKETVQIEISIIEQYYQKKEKEVASIEKEESKVNEMSFLTFKMRDILIKEGQRQDGSNLCSSKMSINRTSNNFFTTSLQSPGSALIQNGIRQNGFELMNSSSRQAGQLQINSRAVSGNRNHQFYTNNNINNTNVLTANQPQILTSISAQNQRSRHTHQYSISNEINLDPEMRMIDQNQNQNEQLPEDISQQELDNIGDKKRKIPKVISLYELYCVFFEISVTVGLSMTFLFIYVISDFKMPPDLILIPWIIWSGKKFIDLARNYKQSIAYLENKFKLRYRDLRRKSKLQRDQQQQFLTSQNPMTQLMSSQNSVRDNNPFFNNTRSLLNIEEQQILRNIRVSSRREDQKLRESKQRQKLKYQCEYAKKFAEVIGLMLYFVIFLLLI